MPARINTTFVIVVSVVLILMTAAVAALFWYTSRKDPSRDLARGDQAMIEGRFSVAADEYLRAFSKQSSNPAIINKYLDAAEKAPVSSSLQAREQVGRIFGMLDRLPQLDPHNVQFFERIAQFYLQIGRQFNEIQTWNALMERSDSFLKQEPQNSVGLKYRGIAATNRMRSLDLKPEEIEQAKQDLLTASDQLLDDQDLQYHLALWHLIQYQQLERSGRSPDRARQLRTQTRELAKKLIEQHPDDLSRQINYVQILVDLGDLTQVAVPLSQLETKLLADPAKSSVSDLLTVTSMIQQTDRSPIERGPSLPQTTRGLQRSEALIENAIKAYPGDIRLLWAIAILHTQQQNTDAAMESFLQITQLNIVGRPVDTLLLANIQQLAKSQYADLLLLKAERTKDTAQRDQYLNQVREIIDQLVPIFGADVSQINLLNGKLAMAKGKWAQATTYIDRASSQMRDSDPRVILLSAQVRQMAGESGAAAARLKTFLDLNPGWTPVRSELIRLQIELRQFEEAQANLDRLLALEPDNKDALKYRAILMSQTGDLDKAIASYDQVDFQKNPDQRITLANLYLMANRIDDARTLLLQAFELDPKNIQLLQLLLRTAQSREKAQEWVQRAAQAGAPKDSIDLLTKLLDSNTTPAQAIESMIDRNADPLQQALARYSLYKQTDRLQDADKELEKAVQINPSSPQVIEAQFLRLLEKKEYTSAKTIVEKAASANADLAQGQFYRGQLELAQSQFERAVGTFRKALAVRPIYSDGWRLLGDAQRQFGDLPESLQSYRSALEQRPNNVLALRGMAATLAQQKEFPQTLEHLRKAVQFAPNDRNLLVEYLTYEETYGQIVPALTVRQRLQQAYPDDMANLRGISILLARAKRPQQAREILDQVIAKEGMNSSNLAALTSIYSLAGDEETARKTIVDYVQNLGDKATDSDWLVLAKFHLSRNEEEKALYAFRKAVSVEDPVKRPASRELADLLFSRNFFPEALNYYQKLYETNPKDIPIVHRYIETLLNAGNVDLASSTLNKLVEHQGPDPTSCVLESLIAQARKDYSAAEAAIRKAIEMAPTRALFHYQLAELLHGRPDKEKDAIDAARQAISLDKNFAPARILLARIYLRQQNIEEATRELQGLIKINPRVSLARRILAELYLSTSDFNALRPLLEESAQLFPQEAGWVRYQSRAAARQGDMAVAIDKMNEAVKINPSPENLNELAQLLFRQKQHQQILDILAAHSKTRDASAMLLAVQGRVLTLLQRPEEGQAAFTKAIQASKTLNHMVFVSEQMSKLMKPARIIEAFTPLALSDKASWVELVVIMNLVNDRQYPQALERLKKIDLLLKPDTPERLVGDRLVGVALHYTGQYEQAREIYERILADDPENIATLNNLAYLLIEKLGKAEEGLKLALRAKRLTGEDAQILDTLGWAYFRNGQNAEAAKTLRRSIELESLPPNTYHLAEVLLASKDSRTEGVKLLEKARQLAEEDQDIEIRDAAAKRLAALKG